MFRLTYVPASASFPNLFYHLSISVHMIIAIIHCAADVAAELLTRTAFQNYTKCLIRDVFNKKCRKYIQNYFKQKICCQYVFCSDDSGCAAALFGPTFLPVSVGRLRSTGSLRAKPSPLA